MKRKESKNMPADTGVVGAFLIKNLWSLLVGVSLAIVAATKALMNIETLKKQVSEQGCDLEKYKEDVSISLKEIVADNKEMNKQHLAKMDAISKRSVDFHLAALDKINGSG